MIITNKHSPKEITNTFKNNARYSSNEITNHLKK